MIIKFQGGPLGGHERKGSGRSRYLTEQGAVAPSTQRAPRYERDSALPGMDTIYVHSSLREISEASWPTL
jgi:hypothetical protein